MSASCRQCGCGIAGIVLNSDGLCSTCAGQQAKVRESDKELAQVLFHGEDTAHDWQIITDHLAAERKAGERLCEAVVVSVPDGMHQCLLCHNWSYDDAEPVMHKPSCPITTYKEATK